MDDITASVLSNIESRFQTQTQELAKLRRVAQQERDALTSRLDVQENSVKAIQDDMKTMMGKMDANYQSLQMYLQTLCVCLKGHTACQDFQSGCPSAPGQVTTEETSSDAPGSAAR